MSLADHRGRVYAFQHFMKRPMPTPTGSWFDRWRPLRALARIESTVLAIYEKVKTMPDKIDDLLAAVANLKTAADVEVAALQTLRDELAGAGTLTADQQARLDTAIGNITAATAELAASANPPA